MTRATASRSIFIAIATLALASVTNFGYAQRAGSRGGGGGSHISAGGHSFSGGTYRGARPAIRSTSGGSNARPGASAYRRPSSGARPANAGARSLAPQGGAAQVARDSQWQSFRSSTGRPSTGGAVASARNSVRDDGHSFAAAIPRVSTATGAAIEGGSRRTFEGQGGEMWERAPQTVAASVAARPGVVAGAFVRSGFGVILPVRPFVGGGFGFGFGIVPLWFWNPFYAPEAMAPYDYDDYPPGIGYDPNYPPNYNPDYNASPYLPWARPSTPANPNWDTSLNAPKEGDAANATGPVVIYMKDGSMVTPADYWVANDQMHYLVDGNESVVDLKQVDLPRTVDENEKNGVKFWIKSAPSEQNAAPSGDAPAAPAAPAPQQNEAPAPKAAPEPQPL